MPEQKFHQVDLESLSEGALLDRPVYLHFKANNRYVCLAKALHLLDPKLYKKLLQVGVAYSDEEPLNIRYPKLSITADAVKEVCLNKTLAPFERNQAIQVQMQWLVDPVFKNNSFPVIFFIQKLLGVPDQETIALVQNFSINVYERSFRIAAVSACLGLWLGYTNIDYLADFTHAVFCEEIAKRYQKENELDRLAKIESIPAMDYRFSVLWHKRFHGNPGSSSGDELKGIVNLAERLQSGNLKKTRVLRKLIGRLNLDLNSLLGEQIAA